MKPDKKSKYIAAITLSKGKMYEYGVPEDAHLQIPEGIELDKQFPLVIGILGDACAEIANSFNSSSELNENIQFASQVLYAYFESKTDQNLDKFLLLSSAVGFFIAGLPGTSSAIIKNLRRESFVDDNYKLAIFDALNISRQFGGVSNEKSQLESILSLLVTYFQNGDKSLINKELINLRTESYLSGTDSELFFTDLLCAVVITQINNSSWQLLPAYSGLSTEVWRNYLNQQASIKILWPSQQTLGNVGVYSGESSIVQMPTSAGKTKAIELILRSTFYSKRASLAVIVAPYRALCQEIADDLKKTLSEECFSVNQLSDALQPDFTQELLEFLGMETAPTLNVLVLTPEKLLYISRQNTEIMSRINLIVFDEGHQFDTGSRGVTYELLLTSIKNSLPPEAQVLLISAVLNNAKVVAEWLLGNSQKVSINQKSQTRRLIGFTAFPSNIAHGQLQFNATSDSGQQFFVPRVISQQRLNNKKGEWKNRFFPTKGNGGEIALYLSLKLVSNGSVAIFAGRKDSVNKLGRNIVNEVFARGLNMLAPRAYSDETEVAKLYHFYEAHFGDKSYLTQAANLGIFLHHGSTPHGIRIALEYAMREALIKLLICTSTLAQGVNLPLKYLLVTSPYQGAQIMKARDFQNLMGRAGRAGMYGEGTIIFTDNRLYDDKNIWKESWRWEQTLDLISGKKEDTGSTLLELVKPLQNNDRFKPIRSMIKPIDIIFHLLSNSPEIYALFNPMPPKLSSAKFEEWHVNQQLDLKLDIISKIESFLMTYRGGGPMGDFVNAAQELARETLAYRLASDEEKMALLEAFKAIAENIEKKVPDIDEQARYGKSLLGVDISIKINEWVLVNASLFENIDNTDELMDVVWNLLIEVSKHKWINEQENQAATFDLIKFWLKGESYASLLKMLHENSHSNIELDELIDFTETTLGYEISLYFAALREAVVLIIIDEEKKENLQKLIDFLQKCLKYGLPSQETVAYYEMGFSDRVIAQDINDAIWLGSPQNSFEAQHCIREFTDDARELLEKYPSYYMSVYEQILEKTEGLSDQV